ncbi:uncharacterized [Tachysurus ichikawai]
MSAFTSHNDSLVFLDLCSSPLSHVPFTCCPSRWSKVWLSPTKKRIGSLPEDRRRLTGALWFSPLAGMYLSNGCSEIAWGVILLRKG